MAVSDATNSGVRTGGRLDSKKMYEHQSDGLPPEYRDARNSSIDQADLTSAQKRRAQSGPVYAAALDDICRSGIA